MIGRRMESFDLKESLLSCSIQVKRVSCGQCVHRSCVAIGASERAFLVVVVVVRVLSFTLQLPPSCIHVYDIDRGPEHQKMGTICRNYEVRRGSGAFVFCFPLILLHLTGTRQGVPLRLHIIFTFDDRRPQQTRDSIIYIRTLDYRREYTSRNVGCDDQI